MKTTSLVIVTSLLVMNPLAAETKIDFVADIKPVLVAKCISCHGAEKQRGGVRLDDRDAAFEGGNTGKILVPGHASKSSLFKVVAGLDPELKMPPGKREGLSANQLALVKAWIDSGADWPKDETANTVTKSSHWSFQPIVEPALPDVIDAKWIRQDLDRFVLARLEKEQVRPSPEADKLTLMRRLYLDLIGIPPSPKEIAEYLADSRSNAYELLVDRLLASPHYGERWARHWLDAARYADSDGFEKDRGRPFAYRYRDWVIEAFNRDLPYDRFVIEQLAGDLLPGATPQQKLATGFHRNTLTNTEGGVDKEQFRVEAVVDRVNTTATVFLGITLGCTQCHDHKYDPFSHREYYQFFAFFNSDVEVNLPIPPSSTLDPSFASRYADYQKMLKALEASVLSYKANELPSRQAEWERELSTTAKKRLPATVRASLSIPFLERTAVQKKVIADHFASRDARLKALNQALADHKKRAIKPPMAQTLALGKERKTHIHIRGDFLRKGVEVSPGTLSCLPEMKASGKPTRLDLAQWIVDPANPLTRRVIVNWVWHKFFGRGIVPTLNDFGTQGESPSHPKLLDHLANELTKVKWSLKALHKLIVTSATYRQASRYREDLQERDAYNVLLARQTRFRLSAEAVRDVHLAASGLLSRKLGGPSVRPPQPAGVSQLTYANSAKWPVSKGEDRYRRGLYIWFQRTSPYPMLMTFDAPDSNVFCVRRERSDTPLQALTLLNDVVFVECAQALSHRILSESKGTVRERLDYAFRACLTRSPTETEVARLSRLYAELLALCQAHPAESAKLVGAYKPKSNIPEAAAWVAVARTILNLDEFVTRD